MLKNKSHMPTKIMLLFIFSFLAFHIDAQNNNPNKKFESSTSINLTKTCKKNMPRNMDDYDRALLQAKLSILDQRLSAESADKVRDFNTNKETFIQSLDQLLINSSVASSCRNKKFTINFQTSINESLLSTILIGQNSAEIAGVRSRVSAIFLARRQSSVRTFRDKEISASKASASMDAIKEDVVTEDTSAYSESTAQQEYSESGGSVLKRSDKILWDVSTSNDLDAAVSQTFASFGYRFIDIAQVEAISNGGLSVEQFKSEFGGGNDLSSKTQSSVFSALSGKIPIFVISTIDIGVADQNPVTSETMVYVSVTAKAYQDDGLFFGTVASVEPQQFSAAGPNQTVAETRALVKAARSASEEIVRQLYAAKIY
jgi:hypothetical protein